MRNSLLANLFAGTAVLLLGAVGCGGGVGTNEIESSLGQSFGGLTAEDEEPMFGEETVYQDLGEASEDPLETVDATLDANAATWQTDADTSVAESEDESIVAANRPNVYGIVVTWGRQIFDGTATETTTWDPTLSTDCGKLVVRRRLAMEAGEAVVRPRTSIDSVSFTSTTGPSFDGAVLILVVPPAGCATGDMAHFTSSELAAPIDVPLDDSLADLVLREDLGDGNNVIALAHELEPRRNDACVRGHLVGRWTRAVEETDGTVHENLGRFYGRVIGELGALRGHIRGFYGVPNKGLMQGKQVFFGKYIDKDGKFKGLLAGRYRDGHFGGGWHLEPNFRAARVRGLLGGGYVAATDLVPDGGLFRGRYASIGCMRQINEQTLEQQ